MKSETLCLTLCSIAVIGIIWCFHINPVLGMIALGIYAIFCPYKS